MNRLIILIFLTFPILTSAQQHVHRKNRVFFPHLSINYNLHNINEVSYSADYTEQILTKSNFFGVELGFTLLPKEDKGYFVEYNNKLVPELGIREIYKLIHVDVGERIVNYTLSSGFCGSLDVGKRLYKESSSEFIAGIRISDKYISGVNNIYFVSSSEPYFDGFHFSPGIFALYRFNINKKNYITSKLAISHSVLNFWKFTENGDYYNFSKPFFTDLNIEFHNKSGLFVKAENTVMFPHDQITPAYRLSFGIGYRF